MPIYPIAASFLISLLAFVGIFTLYLNEHRIQQILIYLISLSAGTLLGGAFLHLLPESLENLAAAEALKITLSAFIVFLLIEKVLHWRHCHHGNCKVHSFGFMNLIGDGVHNFIDGLMIAGAFSIDVNLGIVTSLAVALHELPQELGDFGVLLHAGFHKQKALILNFISALSVVLGAIVGIYLDEFSHEFSAYLLPFAAGGFIYIAASDLLPEIRKERKIIKLISSFLIFLLGIVFMYVVAD